MKFKLIILFVFLLSVFKVYSQNIKELEAAFIQCLEDENADENEIQQIYDKIYAIDQFNETLIYYQVEYYRENNLIDSIKIFYDHLVNSAPNNPKPYILKAEYERRNFSLSDTTSIITLKKALRIDSSNQEIIENLGSYYYDIFQKQYIKDPQNVNLNYYAECVLNFYSKSIRNNNNQNEYIKYPLIQVSYFLNDTNKIKELESIKQDSNNLYFPLESFIFSENWKTNFKIKINYEIMGVIFCNTWYSSVLINLKEPKLFCDSLKKQVFRFTWLRTFHNPIAIRMEKEKDKINLYWKLCDGKGGYNPGKLAIDKSKELSEKEWHQFDSLLTKMNFWNEKTRIKTNGCDGAEWILEGNLNNKYHVVNRWSPNNSNFRSCCLYLLRLTDLEIKADDIY